MTFFYESFHHVYSVLLFFKKKQNKTKEKKIAITKMRSVF